MSVLEEIEQVIAEVGRFAHGGESDDDREAIRRRAREWFDAGFGDDEVLDWLDACCWSPSAAAALRDHGVSPQAARRHREGDPKPIGYRVASGEMSPESAYVLLYE